jgi:hypothetical protein
MKDAFDLIEAGNVRFASFELHHGERIVRMPGPFTVKAARLDEFMVLEQMCTLGVHLKR